MKAMQNKIIAVITNVVLSLVIIAVAGTMSSDVTGNNEGEQNKLDAKNEVVADVNASLLEMEDLFVGVAIDAGGGTASLYSEVEGEVFDAVAEEPLTDELPVDACNADEIQFELKNLLVKSEYEDAFLVNVSEYVNVRKEMNSESEIVGKIFAGQGGKLIWQGETWSYVRSGNVEGYIMNEYAWFGEDVEEHIAEVAQLYAVVEADSLKVRLMADASSEAVGTVSYGDELVIVESGEEWTKVIFENGSSYVATEYISTKRQIGTGMTLEEEQVAIKAEEERQAAIKAEEERQAAIKAEEERKKAEEEAKRAAEEARKQAIANSGFAETVQTTAYSLSEEDAYLMACCVSAEVGNSSYECQLAVANIILNRLKSGAYGSSVESVIYARGQFAVTTNGSMNRYITNGPKSSSVQAVKDALAGNNNMVGYTNFCYLPAADFSEYSSYIILDTEVFYRR